MRKKVENLNKLQDYKLDRKKDKYLEDEYLRIKSSIHLVEKEERFTVVVKFMRICKKLQITPPTEYLQYYSNTRSQLVTELKAIQKKINMHQINNENYKHLEEKLNSISSKLGLATP